MWLSNIGEIRIKEYPKGYVVEIQKKTWYRRRYWTHLISVYGIPSQPWYFSSFNSALHQATLYFEWDLIKGANGN